MREHPMNHVLDDSPGEKPGNKNHRSIDHTAILGRRNSRSNAANRLHNSAAVCHPEPSLRQRVAADLNQDPPI
jgi:hypothetical protein